MYNAVDVCNENATDDGDGDGDGDDDDGDGCNDVDILCASTSLTFADTPKDSLIGFWWGFYQSDQDVDMSLHCQYLALYGLMCPYIAKDIAPYVVNMSLHCQRPCPICCYLPVHRKSPVLALVRCSSDPVLRPRFKVEMPITVLLRPTR